MSSDVRRVLFGRPARFAAAAAVAMALTAVIAEAPPIRRLLAPRPQEGISALVDATRSADYRTVEPRLSGGFVYHPLQAAEGGTSTLGRADLSQRVIATAEAHPTVENLHALGILQLLTDRLDAAVQTLQTALGSGDLITVIATSRDADLLIDFAAASYERSRRQNRAADLAIAFTAAARAVDLAPERPEGWYVHALALQALHLREEAAASWERYLRLDPQSDWAQSARQSLRPLKAIRPRVTDEAVMDAAMRQDQAALRKLLAEAPEQVRTTGEETLLGEAGDGVAEGDLGRTGRALEGAGVIGDAVAMRGDHTLQMAVAQFAEAIRRGDPERISAFGSASVAYRNARNAYAAVRDEPTRLLMLEAAAKLRAVESPLTVRAVIFAATITQYGGKRNAEARELLARAEQSLQGHEGEHPIAAGQALWISGLIDYAEGLPYRAQRSYAQARAYLGRAGEPSTIAGVETVSAETYQYLGDIDSAWTHHLLALKALEEDVQHSRRLVVTGDAAIAAIDLRYYALASVLAGRLSAYAPRGQDHLYAAQAELLKARIATGLGQTADALRLLDRGAALLAEGTTSSAAARLAADIALAQGEALSAGDPLSAERYLTDAIGRFQRIDNQSRAARATLLLGEARQRRGDRQGAERAYLAGLDELERQRDAIGVDRQRSTFTDTGRPLYEAMIAALVARGAETEALAVVRRARATETPLPAPVRRQESTAADGEERPALIEYYLLPDALLTWVTSAGTTHFVRTPVAKAEVAAIVDALGRAIMEQEHRSEWQGRSEGAFELLMRPASGWIAPEQPLAIAADSVLHRVPFAALIDRSSHRFLVEDHGVTSLLGANGGHTAAAGLRRYDSILVTAAPAPPDQPALPMVTREARSVAKAFPRSLLLEGGDATPERLLGEAGRFEVVHFAGHALWNERDPRLAALRLSTDATHRDGSLYAWEIEGERFGKTRLVVLAGCDTARGRLAGVGLLSFARTFIGGGVPQVIGSLWPVDDHSSARLFDRFYAELARGVSPLQSLRNAQLASIRVDGATPEEWAPFQLYEGPMR